MTDQIKSGDFAPASEIVLLANFRNKHNNSKPKKQGRFSRWAIEAVETAWLEAKRRKMENPSPANRAAEEILHLTFKAMWSAA